MQNSRSPLPNHCDLSKQPPMSKNAVYHDGGGQRLLQWRQKRQLRQSDVAAMFDVTPDYICKIETGQRRPGRGLINKMRRLQYHRLAADILRK